MSGNSFRKTPLLSREEYLKLDLPGDVVAWQENHYSAWYQRFCKLKDGRIVLLNGQFPIDIEESNLIRDTDEI